VADHIPFDELDPELMDRYLAGECSAEEMAQVRRWLAAHPDASRRLDTFLNEIGGTRRPAPPNVSASWRAIRGRFRTPESSGTVEPERRPRLQSVSDAPRRVRLDWRWSVATAAACIAVIAGVSYVAARVQPAMSPPVRRSYVTAEQRADFRLPDGTRVRLAPRSRLRAATDFGTERRDVFLEGEAFFDVAPDEARPFTVFAGSASVRDLGTSFDVRAYPGDSAVTVLVQAGAVALSGVGRLEEGDLGRISTAGETQVRRGIAVDSALAWLR
jgi:transmembrane sensor